MRHAKERDRILLISADGKRYMISLQSGQRFHTHQGIIDHDDLIGQPLGRRVKSHLDHTFVVLRPSIHDVLMMLKRSTQIVYPKEIGQILLRLDVCNGRRIIEAGTGSGALTTALANSVQPDGMIYSYEAREEMVRVASRNLERAGLTDQVRLTHRDIAEGFDERDVDGLFLDVREPWDYMPQVCEALGNGGFFGALIPTTNQISWLLTTMDHHPFDDIEVLEILLRKYKPVPHRLRPQDVMVAHTGYLVFARKVAPLEPECPIAGDEIDEP